MTDTRVDPTFESVAAAVFVVLADKHGSYPGQTGRIERQCAEQAFVYADAFFEALADRTPKREEPDSGTPPSSSPTKP